MTETGAMDPSLTPTALAAKAFMERIGNPTYQQIIETRAILGGWVGSRGAGCFDTHLSDAITKAAIAAVMDLFRAWAAECDEPPSPAAHPRGSERTPSPPR